MKQELKPCPLCDTNVDVQTDYTSSAPYYIKCSKCWLLFKDFVTIDDLATKWNTRPDHSSNSTEMVKGQTLTTEIDWEQRRYEIAREMFMPVCVRMGGGEDGIELSESVAIAIEHANELINQLKQQSDEQD